MSRQFPFTSSRTLIIIFAFLMLFLNFSTSLHRRIRPTSIEPATAFTQRADYPEMSLEGVITRYKESKLGVVLRILSDNRLGNVTIYEKFLKPEQFPDDDYRHASIQNVGMDTYAIIYHIVTHYDGGLADWTFFMNGGVESQKKQTFNETMRQINRDRPNLEKFYRGMFLYPFESEFVMNDWAVENKANAESNRTWKFAEVRPLGKWYSTFISKTPPTHSFWKGIFVVHRDRILQYPKKTYLEIQRQLLAGGRDQELAHYLERCWEPMFARDDPSPNQ